MKRLFFIIILASSLALSAQTHKVGISGGVNQLNSWNGDPPFGEGSPYFNKIGSSYDFYYKIILDNNLLFGTKAGLNHLHLHANNFFFRDENGTVIPANNETVLRYWTTGLFSGYSFEISRRYFIEASLGGTLMYNSFERVQSVGYPHIDVEYTRPFENDYLLWGVLLNLDNYFRLYDTMNYGIHLTGSLSATQIFNYTSMDPSNDRVLMELRLGLAVVFGKQKNGRKF